MHALRSYVALLVCVIVSACAPEPAAVTPMQTTPPAGTAIPTETGPQLGAVWRRPADRMDMVFVPSGEFVMGSDREMAKYAKRLCDKSSGELAVATCQAAAFVDEQPAHEVRLDAFWIDRTEVSNAQYQSCVQAKICDEPLLKSSYSRPSYYADPAYNAYPVVNVEWHMAERYCLWVEARLPTEAEWEYAARGPDSRIFPWGNDFDRSRLNYCDAGCPLLSDKTHDDGYADTAPVGTFPSGASWIGALDMAGNAREWVADWLGRYPTGEAVNPTGPETGALKISRGGSWYDTPDDVRSANRGGESLEYYRHNLGFRCAMDVE
jgi:formylglycine-generating enzyme required for sulfatase activity